MTAVESAHRAQLVEALVVVVRAGVRRGEENLADEDAVRSGNSAWLVPAAIVFNLTRAAGTLASAFHTKATTATIRRQLIAVPARLASFAPRLVLHLPKDWPRQNGRDGLRSRWTLTLGRRP